MSEIRGMCWTQMHTFWRQAEKRRAHDQFMAWRIARDPYLTDEKDKDGLRIELRERFLSLMLPAEREQSRGGIRVAQMAQALGPMQTVYEMPDGSTMSKEEWERQHGDRQ